jgi:hypothetical protein
MSMATPSKTGSARSKASALEAFELNMGDADWLVDLAELLRNDRTRRMRRELRDRIGDALRIPTRQRAELECLDNEQVFMTFRPGSADWRTKLEEPNLRPLLRQALVAACAAVETYVADRVMENYATALKLEPCPRRLLDLQLTVDDYRTIATYERQAWGLRAVVERSVREKSSPTPSVVGQLFATVGHGSGLLKKVDKERGCPSGTTDKDLEAMRTRRNKIAHEGDRQGRSRAAITIDEVRRHLTAAKAIVEALEKLTTPGTQVP